MFVGDNCFGENKKQKKVTRSLRWWWECWHFKAVARGRAQRGYIQTKTWRQWGSELGRYLRSGFCRQRNNKWNVLEYGKSILTCSRDGARTNISRAPWLIGRSLEEGSEGWWGYIMRGLAGRCDFGFSVHEMGIHLRVLNRAVPWSDLRIHIIILTVLRERAETGSVGNYCIPHTWKVGISWVKLVAVEALRNSWILYISWRWNKRGLLTD